MNSYYYDNLGKPYAFKIWVHRSGNRQAYEYTHKEWNAVPLCNALAWMETGEYEATHDGKRTTVYRMKEKYTNTFEKLLRGYRYY